MDELYRVGERLGQDSAGLADGMPPGMGGMPPGMPPSMGGMPPGMPPMPPGGADALAEILANGGDIEQYLQSYEQMLAEGMPSVHPQLNQVDAEGGITVRPDPGFVVKTRDANTGTKVFINITSNEHIEAPHLQSLADMEGEEGVRVPLSLGTPLEDFDKKNEPCVTYDLVANPETVDECQKTPAFRETVVNLALAAVGQKYKVELDQRYKLPKMKYKGNVVQLQRIRKKNASNIQEVGSSAPLPGQSAAARQAGMASGGARSDGLKVPEFCVFYSLPNAQAIDGFTADWGPLIEESPNVAEVPHISALDLPVYRVNAWKENIRGTMKNQADREAQEGEDQNAGVAEAKTREMLAGRTCVAQVRLTELDRHVASLKQFKTEVSDECIRISFPMLPKSGKAIYAPLTIWWPMAFCSNQAIADWEPETDTLHVRLPTDLPEVSAEAFDASLLEAVF